MSRSIMLVAVAASLTLAGCGGEAADKGNGAALAGTSAAPMVHDIISRTAAVLGVKPKFGKDGSALLVSY